MKLSQSPHPHQATIDRLRSMTHVLDNAIVIPGTEIRFGLDPILGLLPGGGDAISSLMSVYLVIECLRLGLPKATLGRMLSNLLFDTIVGAVPVAGDLFDVGWKANTRNLKLLEAHLNDPMPQAAADKKFIFLVILGLIAILALALLLTTLLVAAVGVVWRAIVR
jgi:Domain of unknown function (DUF4112)